MQNYFLMMNKKKLPKYIVPMRKDQIKKKLWSNISAPLWSNKNCRSKVCTRWTGMYLFVIRRLDDTFEIELQRAECFVDLWFAQSTHVFGIYFKVQCPMFLPCSARNICTSHEHEMTKKKLP